MPKILNISLTTNAGTTIPSTGCTDDVKDALVFNAICKLVKENVKKPPLHKPSVKYKEVVERVQKYLGLPRNNGANHYSDYYIHVNDDLAKVLGRISQKCLDQNLAPITILVENDKEEVSGEGFIAYQDKERATSFATAWNSLLTSSPADFKEIVDFIQEIVAISYGLK